MSATTLDVTTPWAMAVMADVAGMGATKGAWSRLLEHASKGVRGSQQPSQRWRSRAEAIVAEIKTDEFLYFLDMWFTGISGPGSRFISARDGIAQKDQLLLSGLVWVAAQMSASWLMPRIALMAECSYQKIAYGKGLRAARLGNVCIKALGAQRDALSIAHLCELKDTLHHQGAQRLVAAQLGIIAMDLGTTTQALHDLVPDFGLDASGCVEHEVGGWRALIEVSAEHVHLTWQRQLPGDQGELFGEVEPAEVRRSRPTRLDSWTVYKARIVEVIAWQIEHMLGVQRTRLEGLSQRARSWSFATWQAEVLRHPLLWHLAKGLIWRVEDMTGRKVADLCWATGHPVDAGAPGSTWHHSALQGGHVRLWHPLLEDARALLWQDWIIQGCHTQPFKQAFRETYSGAHLPETHDTLVRQHQFQALLRQLGWHTTLQGTWAGCRHPVWRTLSAGVTCRLRLAPLVDDAIVTKPGAYVYTKLCGIEFVDAKGQPLGPECIDEVARSEAIREVAFASEISTVSQAQVDEVLRGALGRLRLSTLVRSVGGWSQAARLRAQVLGKLIPRTHWMRNHMRIEEGFLCCELESQTWRIELGSGLVWSPQGRLMEVPVRHDAPRVILPYQGDQTLQQIVARSWKIVTGSVAHLARSEPLDAPGRRSS